MRLAAAATLLAAAFLARPALGFDLDDVASRARELAARPYRAPEAADPRVLKLHYDAWRAIRFRREHALWHGESRGYEVQWLYGSAFNPQPVKLHELADGAERAIDVDADAFDYGKAFAGTEPPRTPDVAGFRVVVPQPDGKRRELIAFFGASYFRAPGPGQGQYGLSARGLAIDTVAPQREEFPRFAAYWFERPPAGAAELTLYALLDSPRASGAFRFVVRPGDETVVDVQARVFLRAPVAMFGIAPLTSMFLSGENQPRPGGFRPEVHDSDGLQIATADGEWIWRPLVNPPGVLVRRFALSAAPRGFGLMQRDRAFSSYEDTEAVYERRPSAWVEPRAGFGAGRIETMAYMTRNEFNDNVVAYWVPAIAPKPGEAFDAAWRIRWQGDAMQRPPLAWVAQTRRGHGGAELKPGEVQFVVDFVGGPLDTLPPDEKPQAQVDVVAGPARDVEAHLLPNRELGGWRMSLRFARGDPRREIELRAVLTAGGQRLSETWSYVLPPE